MQTLACHFYLMAHDEGWTDEKPAALLTEALAISQPCGLAFLRLMGVSGLQTEISPSLGSTDAQVQGPFWSSSEHPRALEQECRPVWARTSQVRCGDGHGCWAPALLQTETFVK